MEHTLAGADAANRQRTTTLDAPKGRPTVIHVAGLHDLALTYDNRSRIAQLVRGARTETRTYHPDGRLATITDPANRTTTYQYDAAGRLTRTILPGNRTIDLTYAANGNPLTIIPPSRPAHTFAYTAADQESQYTPPSLGQGNWSTLQSYFPHRIAEFEKYRLYLGRF